MKIRETDNSLLGKTLELEKQKTNRSNDEKGVDSRKVASEQRVSITLAKSIMDTLDPVKLEAESQARIANFKSKIESGAYWSGVDLKDVAKKIDEEISLEIVTDKKYVEEA